MELFLTLTTNSSIVLPLGAYLSFTVNAGGVGSVLLHAVAALAFDRRKPAILESLKLAYAFTVLALVLTALIAVELDAQVEISATVLADRFRGRFATRSTLL